MLITWEGFTVQLTRRRNCRRATLRFHRDTGLFSLSVPTGMTSSQVSALLSRQLPWMQEQAAHTAPRPDYAPGTTHPVLGRTVTLGEGGVPAGREAFLRWRAAQLSALVQQLLPRWAQRMGVAVHALRWRDMRSRWGSCRPDTRDLTLNLRLGAFPPECVELVVVHELCHLRHPDHSPAFYADMTRLLPDWKAREQQLRALQGEIAE